MHTQANVFSIGNMAWAISLLFFKCGLTSLKEKKSEFRTCLGNIGLVRIRLNKLF